jgi:hypothetical protein
MGEWYETPLARSILEDMRVKAQKRLGMKRWLERQAVWDARRARRQEIARELALAEHRRRTERESQERDRTE